jgi:hypothetical protein
MITITHDNNNSPVLSGPIWTPSHASENVRFSEYRLQRVIFKYDSFRLGTLYVQNGTCVSAVLVRQSVIQL